MQLISRLKKWKYEISNNLIEIEELQAIYQRKRYITWQEQSTSQHKE